MQAMRILRNPRFWGAGTLTFVTVVGLIAAMLYISPPGNKMVTFFTDDAASITPGITVRVAGVTVGKIKDLSFEHNQVRVRATVDDGAFIGDESQVQVRMLTVVGGYFVNIDSLGSVPLGTRVIPKDRVELPYNLVKALVDATTVTEQVHTASINQSLNEVQHGLDGPNIQVVSSIIDAGTKLTETLDRQRGQVSDILDMSDEYLEELARYRDQFTQLIQKIAILEATLTLYGKGASAAAMGLAKIVQGLGPVTVFYANHRDEFLAKFSHWQQIVRTWADRSGLIVRILQRTRERMYHTLEVQNTRPELLATDLCIPLPESPC
ncbi:Mce family protein [Mycobacteroides abscessus subsp. massiliense]|nr:Mce family protein [Mycobacteroides abscessus subsp. massiliense]